MSDNKKMIYEIEDVEQSIKPTITMIDNIFEAKSYTIIRGNIIEHIDGSISITRDAVCVLIEDSSLNRTQIECIINHYTRKGHWFNVSYSFDFVKDAHNDSDNIIRRFVNRIKQSKKYISFKFTY